MRFQTGRTFGRHRGRGYLRIMSSADPTESIPKENLFQDFLVEVKGKFIVERR
jgi:hypothetical protein